MKKASVNGRPALLHSELPRFSYLPGFASYMEIDSLGLVSALNDRGEIIGLSWQPIVEGDRIQVEQDLYLADQAAVHLLEPRVRFARDAA